MVQSKIIRAVFRMHLEQFVCGCRVVAVVSPPLQPSGWWCGEEGPLQVDLGSTNRKAVPQVLAEPAATVRIPGGERRMTICPPAWPFTACLTALSLRGAMGQAGLDWAGLQ